MVSRGLCRGCRDLAEIGLVRRLPPERLMRTSPIIPVEEFGEAALLFDTVGRRTQIDPFVLHGPPQALDEDVIVAAPAPVHADLDPVIPQQRRELVAGELRALVGIEDTGLAAHSPSFLISRRIRRRPTGTPSRRSATWSRRLPYTGWSVKIRSSRCRRSSSSADSRRGR